VIARKTAEPHRPGAGQVVVADREAAWTLTMSGFGATSPKKRIQPNHMLPALGFLVWIAQQVLRKLTPWWMTRACTAFGVLPDRMRAEQAILITAVSRVRAT